MKFLTVLFRPDGSYFGTQGHEYPLPAWYKPPGYLPPGEAEWEQLVAVHLGVAEMPGEGRCVSTDLSEVLMSHPDSTPGAPKFAVKDWALMPQIHDAPCTKAEWGGWLRKNGVARLPKFFRAWMTLHDPELAAEYRLDRGITIDDMLELEKKRVVRAEHSRTEHLQLEIQRRKHAKRVQLFERNRQRVHERLVRADHDRRPPAAAKKGV